MPPDAAGIVNPQVELQSEVVAEGLSLGINVHASDVSVGVTIVRRESHTARAAVGGIRRGRDEAGDAVESVGRRAVIKAPDPQYNQQLPLAAAQNKFQFAERCPCRNCRRRARDGHSCSPGAMQVWLVTRTGIVSYDDGVIARIGNLSVCSRSRLALVAPGRNIRRNASGSLTAGRRRPAPRRWGWRRGQRFGCAAD